MAAMKVVRHKPQDTVLLLLDLRKIFGIHFLTTISVNFLGRSLEFVDV